MSSTKTKKHLERIALALRIERCLSAEEMSPCDSCIRSRRRCIAATAESARCAECVRHGRSSCNFQQKLPTVSDWASIDRQRKKLRDERNETMAKLLRLSKMEEALEAREQKMIELGVGTLEELDAKEAEERAEAARLEASSANLLEASTFLDNFVNDPEALGGLPESFWASIGSAEGAVGSPGFLTGTVGPDPGSSSSAYVPTYFPRLHILSISLGILADPLVLS